jgi:hypothetical protein
LIWLIFGWSGQPAFLHVKNKGGLRSEILGLRYLEFESLCLLHFTSSKQNLRTLLE